jgi:hypothetical protein
LRAAASSISSAHTASSKYRPHHHEGSIGLLHQFDESFNR